MAYDLSTSKIVVEFRGKSASLPVSHTCFRTIEIPLYKSFEDMKKKLDVAFLLASESFGLA